MEYLVPKYVHECTDCELIIDCPDPEYVNNACNHIGSIRCGCHDGSKLKILGRNCTVCIPKEFQANPTIP